MDIAQIAYTIGVAAIAVWDARTGARTAVGRVASLGGNLGPRVQQLENDVAYLKGRLGIPLKGTPHELEPTE